MKIKVEEKEVTTVTRVFAIEFTQGEVDAITDALEKATRSYSSRRATPELARAQRLILQNLSAHENVTPINIDDDDDDEEMEDDNA